MKPLHKITPDKNREFTQVFMVKGHKVVCFNGHVGLRLSAEEVFGKGVEFNQDEELYFSKDTWGAARMDKAVKIVREGLLFKGFDAKGRPLGFVEALTSIGQSFHEFDEIYPTEKPIGSVGLNSDVLKSITEATGCSLMRLDFYGKNINRVQLLKREYTKEDLKQIDIEVCVAGMLFPSEDGQAVSGEIFPKGTNEATLTPEEQGVDIDTSVENLAWFENRIVELEDLLEGAKEDNAKLQAKAIIHDELQQDKEILADRIEELEADLMYSDSVTTGLGEISWKTENLELQSIMEEVMDLIKSGNAREVIDTMKMLA